MTKKDITPTNPDKVKVEDADEAPSERKTMNRSWVRKTMSRSWSRKTMNRSWSRKTMSGNAR